MEHLEFKSKDGKTQIHATIWLPEGEIKGVVQIIHGMAEYGERYALFAQYLSENGYLVGVNDHIGHGKSINSDDDLGYFAPNGYEVALEDLREFTKLLKEYAPQAPVYLLGHSMGSFFCRRYISLYGEELKGAIIMGSGYQSTVTTFAALTITKIISAFKGERYRSKFVDNLAFGAYNKKIAPVRTKFDWLSVNQDNVDKYVADEKCGITFTCNGFETLFNAVKYSCAAQTFKNTPKNLPILLVSGSDDPVGDYGKAIEKIYDLYCKNGVENVDMILYRGARHEILNDICAVQVQEDILSFLNANNSEKA